MDTRCWISHFKKKMLVLGKYGQKGSRKQIRKEKFQTVLLFKYIRKKILLRFFDVSWIDPFFSFKYTLNGVIKMDNLIILLVSKQVLLTLKSVIFVPLLLPFSLHPSPAFLSELSYPLFWTTGSHTWLSQQFMAFKNRDFVLS